MMMRRRSMLKMGLGGAGLIAMGPAARSLAAAVDPSRSAISKEAIVATRYGRLRGRWHRSVAVFKGIAYGAPTGASARFMPPREPKPWHGTKEALDYGPSCPQIPLGLSPFLKPGTPVPPPSHLQRELMGLFTPPSRSIPQNEDCLRLNVWTPALDRRRRPVMVWLHGGGFAVGSGSSPEYDGANLARRGDVVVVTINHRLNVFGYLYLGKLGGERFAPSGNVGMLDIVAALKWVRDNIENLGGDPQNVTIFGESGGAGKVSIVCALPAANGLFHKAIMQSGPCLDIQYESRAEAIADRLRWDLRIPRSKVERLQQVDAVTLGRAARAAENEVAPPFLGETPSGLTPLVDHRVIFHNPFDPVAPPESADVPFIVGSTRSEGMLFTVPMPDWGRYTYEQVHDLMRPIAGSRAETAVTLYRKLHPQDSPSYILADLLTDAWMRQAANRVAEAKALQRKAPAYVYVLEWEINRQLRTPHGTDVTLVFDTVSSSALLAGHPEAQRVSDQMSAAWAAFAHTGSPNSPGMPPWPAYDLRRRANMLFDVHSRVVGDYGSEARRFWEAPGAMDGSIYNETHRQS